MSSSSSSTSITNKVSIPVLDSDIDERDTAKLRRIDANTRPLVLFGIDMTNWSPIIQYLVLFGGLILFMCLYGYYQELVIYGWFDRKLSVFSTFLHFLGCSVFAQIQRNLSFRPNVLKNGSEIGTHPCHFCSMGNAPTKLAIFYYSLLVLVRAGGQGMSNLSMTQINYPAKVLFKSANPVVTMIIGVTFLRKTYPLRDYLVVILLVIGLYIFIAGDATESPSSTRLGIIYVVISMFGSAGVPMIQEHCMMAYNASIEDLLYHCYVGSTVLTLVVSVALGEFGTGVMFLVKSGSVHTWLLMAGFCTFGYVGNNFSAALTLQYGALVNGISNTFRKAVTIALSFLMFPERNILTSQKLFGTIIFFAGLLIRIFSKAEASPWQALMSLLGYSTTDKISISKSVSGESDRVDEGVTVGCSSGLHVPTMALRNGSDAVDIEKATVDETSGSSNMNESMIEMSQQSPTGKGRVSNGLLPPLHSNGHVNKEHPHYKLSAAARFQAMILAESSDNLLDIETAYMDKHEDGTILTGPFAGREFSNDEGDDVRFPLLPETESRNGKPIGIGMRTPNHIRNP